MIYQCEYFGYNSLLTQHGTRIRRLRRTEVTAEKIACARIRSPNTSSQKLITNGFLRENRSSEAQLNHTNSRSKLSYKYIPGQRLNYRREKEDSSRQEMSRANPNALESQNGSFYQLQAHSKQSIKDSVAQYYLKCRTAHHFQSKSKKGLRRLQSHDSSTQSIRKTQMNNNFRPLKQSQQLSKTSNVPYIPRCINKQLLQNNVEAAIPVTQPVQVSLKSSIYDEVQCKKVSKKMSSMNCSVVSRSSYVSESAKNENLSIQDNYRSNNNQSQVHNYSHTASDYGLERKNVKPSLQIGAFYSNKELKSSQHSLRSKKSGKQTSKVEGSSLKQSKQSSQVSEIKNHSKLSNQVQAQYQTQRKNDKQQKFYLTKKSTSAEQSCKSNEADNYLVFEFNKNKEGSKKQAHESIAMSDTKGLRITNEKDYISTLQKEKKAVKFNPQVKTETFQAISTPQKNSNKSKLQQQLSSSVKSERQQQSLSSIQSSKQSTLSSLMRQIEQHQMRLGFIYLFIDNTRQTYKGAIQFQRYERLCFLMFKKYLFEMNRVVEALRGGPNCFKLSGIQIKPETLYKFLNSSLFSEKINYCVDQSQQLFKKIEIQWHRISKKYNKDKLVRLQYTKDNFTKEIVKLLMQELTKLYQELQSEEMENDQIEQTQKRITEIIQIMFLLSQLTGRKVKNFELLSQLKIDFNEYYALNYQKIIETHQFFQKLE